MRTKYDDVIRAWLDGAEVEEMRPDVNQGRWHPFGGYWMIRNPEWQYRIAKPAEKPKEERWLYVNKRHDSHLWIAEEETEYTIGKIRMEDV